MIHDLYLRAHIVVGRRRKRAKVTLANVQLTQTVRPDHSLVWEHETRSRS